MSNLQNDIIEEAKLEADFNEAVEAHEKDEEAKKTRVNEGYPKYQYSIFLKNGRDEQLVIRANDFNELIEAKKNIDLILTKREASEPVKVEPVKEDLSVMCPIHNVAMIEKEGQYGKYWSHSKKEGEMLFFCNGKGYKEFATKAVK